MNIKIKKTTECKMGNNPTASFEIYVDGELVGCVKRKYHAEAIALAIRSGHIHPSGDTEMAFDRWAYSNDRKTFDRLSA